MLAAKLELQKMVIAKLRKHNVPAALVALKGHMAQLLLETSYSFCKGKGLADKEVGDKNKPQPVSCRNGFSPDHVDSLVDI